jgi:hypothetical protein
VDVDVLQITVPNRSSRVVSLAGNATETINDFKCRGGKLMISLLISPRRIRSS